MTQWLNDPEKWRWQNTAPPDPVLNGARAGRPNYNSATGFKLFHQSMMPLGEHAGKIMQRVPARDLLKYHAEFRTLERKDKRKWFPIYSYVQRHLKEIQQRSQTERIPEKQRDYIIIHQSIFVSAQEASKTTLPRYKCEICRDEPVPCECDPEKRLTRARARIS